MGVITSPSFDKNARPPRKSPLVVSDVTRVRTIFAGSLSPIIRSRVGLTPLDPVIARVPSIAGKLSAKLNTG